MKTVGWTVLKSSTSEAWPVERRRRRSRPHREPVISGSGRTCGRAAGRRGRRRLVDVREREAAAEPLRHQVQVVEDDPLGAPGRTGRVHHRGDVPAPYPAAVRHARRRRRRRRPGRRLFQERSPCRSAAARETTTTSFRSEPATPEHLVDLLLVGDDEDARPGMAEHVGHLLRVELAGGKVDDAIREAGDVGERRLERVLREDRDLGSLSPGEREQPLAMERVRRARSATVSSAPSVPRTRMATTRGSVSSRDRSMSPKVGRRAR